MTSKTSDDTSSLFCPAYSSVQTYSSPTATQSLRVPKQLAKTNDGSVLDVDRVHDDGMDS